MTRTYRATHVPSGDVVSCRLAVGATHLDFHTRGKVTTTPEALRSFQERPKRTDADDLRKAWERGFGQTLVIRNGSYLDTLLGDRAARRFVSLDVWYGSAHTIGIAPENSRGRWLVSDPALPDWVWADPEPIKLAAWEWGRRVLGMPHEPLGLTRNHLPSFPYATTRTGLARHGRETSTSANVPTSPPYAPGMDLQTPVTFGVAGAAATPTP